VHERNCTVCFQSLLPYIFDTISGVELVVFAVSNWLAKLSWFVCCSILILSFAVCLSREVQLQDGNTDSGLGIVLFSMEVGLLSAFAWPD
jgi:hypothetical protein